MSSAPLPLSPTTRTGRSLGSRHESTLAAAVTAGFPGVRLCLAVLPAKSSPYGSRTGKKSLEWDSALIP